jgi:hypothetical protein
LLGAAVHGEACCDISVELEEEHKAKVRQFFAANFA